MTSKRMRTGLVAGLLAALALVAVGVGAYRAGQHHDGAVATVPGATGEVVRVVADGHWRGGALDLEAGRVPEHRLVTVGRPGH